MENIYKKWQHYCCEDLSNIENFDKAILAPENYIIHHRLGVFTSRDELKEHCLYYNRPAKELIFLTKSEHSSLHGKINGWHLALQGATRTPESIAKMLKTREANKANSQYRILCLTNNTLYHNAAAAARDLHLQHTSNIFKVCNGERKTVNGYEFRYYTETDTTNNPSSITNA